MAFASALAGRDGPQDLRSGDWLLIGSLYITQFLGLGFFVTALAAILRQAGAPLSQVGMIYMLGLVWPLKPLWAPLIDRFGFGRFGHYRGWLIFLQTLMVLALLILSFFSVIEHFSIVYALCFFVSLASATQDIAVDALACRLVPPARRGFANGIQVAGGLIGNLLGGGATLVAYPFLGWRGCMVILAVSTCLPLLQLLRFREPPSGLQKASMPDVYKRAWSFWRSLPSPLWIALLIVFPIGNGLAYGILTPMLTDGGWPLEQTGFVVNGLGSLCGLVCALATGWLVGRFGRRRMLVSAAFLQVLGVAAMALPAFGGASLVSGTVAALLFFCSYNPASTVLATLMMDHCSPRSPGTDYTLQNSASQIVSISMMMAATALAIPIGYGGVVILASILALLAALLSLAYRTDSSRHGTAQGLPQQVA